MSDQELRLECLKLAVESMMRSEDHEIITTAADAFYKFLSKE